MPVPCPPPCLAVSSPRHASQLSHPLSCPHLGFAQICSSHADVQSSCRALRLRNDSRIIHHFVIAAGKHHQHPPCLNRSSQFVPQCQSVCQAVLEAQSQCERDAACTCSAVLPEILQTCIQCSVDQVSQDRLPEVLSVIPPRLRGTSRSSSSHSAE